MQQNFLISTDLGPRHPTLDPQSTVIVQVRMPQSVIYA